MTSLLIFRPACARQQQYEWISTSNHQQLRELANQSDSLITSFQSPLHAVQWLSFQSFNIRKMIPDESVRREFLRMVHYESMRFNLDPDLVLALIEIESRFKIQAVSSVGAVGLMQIMPFWKSVIGQESDSLFELRTNIRYGCLILRHYLDIERDQTARALARYNGSLADSRYSSKVIDLFSAKYRYPSEALR
jgi:soluble lytic murein transglycosylase-like protein